MRTVTSGIGRFIPLIKTQFKWNGDSLKASSPRWFDLAMLDFLCARDDFREPFPFYRGGDPVVLRLHQVSSFPGQSGAVPELLRYRCPSSVIHWSRWQPEHEKVIALPAYPLHV